MSPSNPVRDMHWARAGHGPQVVVGNLTTMTSVPRWVAGLQEVLVRPWGQVTCRVSKSMVKQVLSYPVPARAWTDWSSRAGVTMVTPNVCAAVAMTSAEG